ncbi:biotin--[acetyl-CoA-carboxylase] ligase [Thiomicrospira sp. ALE5]|uniref:biotin--[acetyl-CoA-carboxylase] ligase n=1 Tax=Thiomicrospira sp. ALE5 TaxID=748650 RepID=UPI0008E609CD|nr:biotin--[acetyl-CoA-carboxylase] ligase [Thiomicrospira sp. ALE5]SFR61585.1 BirA family transcriptional regulator, biotin operon repressor / biotin-[acetyl-CoA-carboxylase] ligase [Thiomicrospira sp. ALE5]
MLLIPTSPHPCYRFNFSEIDSTNNFLKKVAGFTTRPVLCTAAYQHSGYGQQGRAWCSKQNDLMMSLMLSVPNRFIATNGLSQSIALCIANSLGTVTDQLIQVKWPNDIFIDGGKAGGVLIEIVRTVHDQSAIIIGFGLNLTKPDDSVSLDYPAGSLLSCLDSMELANLCATNLINALVGSIKKSSDQSHINDSLLNINDWQRLDYFKLNETIRVIYPNGDVVAGVYCGLDQTGQALIYNASLPDELIKVSTGLVQLRRHD